MERPTSQERGDRKLQKEYRRQIPQTRPYRLDHGLAGEKGLLPRRVMGRVLRTAENTGGCSPLNHRGSLIRVLTRIQSHWQTGFLSFSGAATPQILASLEILDMVKMYAVTLMMGTNDVSRGESRKVLRLHEKISCILEELRIQMDPAILTICTVLYNMKADQHSMEMNEKVRNINEIIRQIQRMAEWRLPETHKYTGSGSAGIGPVHLRSTPGTPFFATRSLSNCLGVRADSRDSSRRITSSVVSSVVVVDHKRVEKPTETSRTRYLERIKELDLEDLECRQELAETLELKHVSHEDLSRHHCVDWLKAHEAHFSRTRIMETADLTGIPLKSIMGPINYRPLKLLGSHRGAPQTPNRLATPAQLRIVDKLLDPKDMGLPDAAYEGGKLANDSRYGRPCGNAQLAKTLAVYD